MARKKTVKSETTDLAQPQNRTEEFLAKIAGLVDTLPQGEFSRLERYLKYIAENGGGGGGGGVTSFNTRTGAVTPQSGDYSTSTHRADTGLATAWSICWLPMQMRQLSRGSTLYKAARICRPISTTLRVTVPRCLSLMQDILPQASLSRRHG